MWIPSDPTLKDHPKLVRLMTRLKISRIQAIGHLHVFWWWAACYTPHGSLASFSPEEISAGAMWEGDAATFLGAMVSSGFIDAEPLAVHDWDDWAGAYQARKAEDRDRKRRERQAQKEGKSVAKPAPKTSDGRPTDVARMSCVEVGEVGEVGEGVGGQPPISSSGGPTEREVVVEGLRQNIPPGYSKRYFNTANSTNRWRLRDGRKLVWSAELTAWWMKDKAAWREPKDASRPSHEIERELQIAPTENEMLRKLLLVELDFARTAEKGN